jgi:hypothetical protein
MEGAREGAADGGTPGMTTAGTNVHPRSPKDIRAGGCHSRLAPALPGPLPCAEWHTTFMELHGPSC